MDTRDFGPERNLMARLIAAGQLPKPQRLRQQGKLDCSVPVFAALAGMSEDDVREDLPKAARGEVTVDEWVRWLEGKGLRVSSREGCPTDVVPCAHLVSASVQGGPFHWVFRDEDGDVHDPSPTCAAMPASDQQMRDLSVYGQQIRTLSIKGPSSKG